MSTTNTGGEETEFTDVAHLSVENVGGIENTSVTFQKGLTLLEGRNATNRTSLLRAISGVLGGTDAALKSDADEGRVSLELDSETYTRTYERTETEIRENGEPYEKNEELIDLFSSLLEDNPARLAVERGDDLRDLIMRPVDTKAIERRIRTLQSEREEISEEIESVEQQSKRLPQLEEQRQTLERELESIDDEIEELRTEAAEFEADADMVEAADELVDQLDDRCKELSEAEDDFDLVEAELAALRDRPAELRSDREELPEYTQADLKRVQDELQTVRAQKRDLENTIVDLSSIVEFNEDILSDSGAKLPESAGKNTDPTAALAPKEEQEVTCWTCGNQAERGTIANQLENLRSVVTEKQTERAELENRVTELETEEETIRGAIEKRNELEQQIGDVKAKIESKRERHTTLEERVAELRETISDLEAEVAVTEELRGSGLLETYERISELQYERGQKREQLTTVKDELEEIESLPEKATLQKQLENVRQDLNRERGRVDELESRSISQFNEHMDEMLDVLGYENISRVWIERKEEPQRGSTSNSSFDLHVVRESETGVAYEDTISTLSESEREVIGLIVALAGYLVHEVYQDVPFMLLDSLEPIDAERIADLVEYFAEYAPYLVVALLPEDASRLENEYEMIPADVLN